MTSQRFSSEDERGVSLRDFRPVGDVAGEDSGRAAATEPASAGYARPDPAVPAAIVARAKAAMRQANQSPSPDHDGEHAADRAVTTEATVPPAPASPHRPPDPPDSVGTRRPACRPARQPAVDAEEAGGKLPARPERAAPTARPTSPGAATEAAPVAPWERPAAPENAAGPPEAEPASPWSGYNPDYVADHLVPLIQARATTGWRSRLGLQPSRVEQQRQRLRAAMCVNFGRPVKIVLANPRGSSGKTIMTVLLAGALGLARGGGVCAFENHELRGVMALRTVTNGTQRTTRDFINDLAQMTPEQVRHADLTRYVRHQHAGNYDAMVTSRSFEKQLRGDEHRAASALLERFYQIIVIDTANNEAHEAFRAAMEDATVLVVPTKWRPTHITPATQMLNDMAALSPRHRLLVQNAVIAASNGAGEAVRGARETALPMFQALAHTVVEIPPDPHIEADRPILHNQLRPVTRNALDQLGAATCAAAVTNLREMENL